MKALKIALSAITFFLLSASCSNNDVMKPGNQPGIDEVWMQNIKFVPEQKSVTVGSTVTWINKDQTIHTVTSDDGLFDAEVQGGGQFSYTFDSVGTYNYHCKIHADMIGSINVNNNIGGNNGSSKY